MIYRWPWIRTAEGAPPRTHLGVPQGEALWGSGVEFHLSPTVAAQSPKLHGVGTNPRPAVSQQRGGRVQARATQRWSIRVGLLLICAGAFAQVPPRPPQELIRFLTYQSGRSKLERLGAFSCGSLGRWEQADRETANALVKLGDSALPDLERAFDSILKSGQKSHFAFNSAWLFYAYARLLGRSAYPRLAQLIDSSPADFQRFGLDNAMALALGLTSYVGPYRSAVGPFICEQPAPRDALDQLISGWQRNERGTLESALGPRAKAVLQPKIENGGWDALRTRLLTSSIPRPSAVGYHFDVAGGWSEPRETLAPRSYDGIFAAFGNLLTSFYDKTGISCGSMRVLFVQVPHSTSITRNRFVVDSPDVTELLKVISACSNASR